MQYMNILLDSIRWPSALWCYWESWSVFSLGPVSISNKTSYCKISWSLEAARLVVYIITSLWHLTGTSAALLPMCLSNFRAIGRFWIQISRLRDITIRRLIGYWNGAQVVQWQSTMSVSSPWSEIMEQPTCIYQSVPWLVLMYSTLATTVRNFSRVIKFNMICLNIHGTQYKYGPKVDWRCVTMMSR